MTMELRIESETAPLEAVVLHSPGAEIEAMTPTSARELLYNDIVPLTIVRRDHGEFKRVLSQVATVYELRDLARSALEDSTLRTGFCAEIAAEDALIAEDLLRRSPEEIVAAVVEGIPLRRDSLQAFLSDHTYARPPLPNLYFMRDSAAVLRSGYVTGAMAHPVRAPESLLLSLALKSLVRPDTPHLFAGSARAREGALLEGGDLLVLDRNTLLVGLSSRTNAAAIDLLVQALIDRFQEPITTIAVPLSRERHAIHLDMLFTMIDRDCALLYGPDMVGENPLPVVTMQSDPARAPVFTRHPSLLRCLESLGRKMETVLCGGRDTVRGQREQWLSGTNALALAPGKIVVYDCNEATLEELNRAGFSVYSSQEIPGDRDATGVLTGAGRVAITIPGAELARGGGGPRCMSLPLRRRTGSTASLA
ncbi:MAG: hypothetical protein EA427_05690 [Spirochaetaceae bacterium]|nr:MAG: hypothetical protein EA427_05690 [Spirochaetaceae bacterium]